VSSISTVVSTASIIENDWRLTELMMQTWTITEFPEFVHEDFIGNFSIDDLDAPAAVTAAFTYCG